MTMKLWLAGITGLVIGILAAAAQAFANVEPPEAYAVCMVCHPATIVQWIMNNYLGTEVPLPSAFVLFPFEKNQFTRTAFAAICENRRKIQ